MSILVFAEIQDGKIKKSSLEAVSYARQVPGNSTVNVVVLGPAEATGLSELAKYGADKIYHAAGISGFDPAVYAAAIAEADKLTNAEWMIISNTYTGKSYTDMLLGVGGRLGAQIYISDSFMVTASLDAFKLSRGSQVVVGNQILVDIPPVFVGSQIMGGLEF